MSSERPQLPVPGEDELRQALRRVHDPCSVATGAVLDIVEMGLVKRIACEHGAVHVELRLTSPLCFQAPAIFGAIERAVGAVRGVQSVSCSVDHADPWMPPMMAASARRRLRAIRPASSQSDNHLFVSEEGR